MTTQLESQTEALIRIFGSAKRLAEAANVDASRVSRWRAGGVPLEKRIALIQSAPMFGVDPQDVYDAASRDLSQALQHVLAGAHSAPRAAA